MQQKAGGGSAQLQDYRSGKGPAVSSAQGMRALAGAQRSASFAAAPFLQAMRRCAALQPRLLLPFL